MHNAKTSMKYKIFVIILALLLIQAENIHTQILNNLINIPGVDVQLGFTNDFLSNLSGGIKKGSSYIGLVKTDLNIDLDKSFGMAGTSMLISAIGVLGNDFNDKVGSEQGIDNIEAYRTWKIYEFWIEQKLFNDNLSLKFGLYDLNSEFDVQQASLIFLNPSQGIGPEYALTGENGPSIYPTTSLAFRFDYKNKTGFYTQAAIIDGVAGDPNKPIGTQIILNKDDGLLLACEIGFAGKAEVLTEGYEKYSLGGWYYTNRFKKITLNNSNNTVYKKGNYGIYFSAEKFLWSEPKNTEEGLSAFVRVGISDRDLNQVDGYVGLGLHYTGLFSCRDQDQIGIALASAHNNTRYLQSLDENIQPEEFESIIEMTYLFYFSSWFQLQPDIQYVINPAYSGINDYSFISSIRVQLFF